MAAISPPAISAGEAVRAPPAPAGRGELPPREQKILRMRFADDMTQAQIGQQLGISQMHVSRLSAHALGYLRQRLLGPQEHRSAARPASARASGGGETEPQPELAQY